MGDEIKLPPFNQISTALRETTERLARELAQPQASAPGWTQFEWDMARVSSAAQGISGLLANRLRWRGPDDWQEFLRWEQYQTVLRDLRIAAVMKRLNSALRNEVVPVIALKGAALREMSLYAAGERPMGDIDLLGEAANFPAIARALHTLGYRESPSCERHQVFVADTRTTVVGFGEHIANSLNVEVHPAISEPLPLSLVDVSPQIFGRRLGPGINSYPSLAALMTHLLLHAAGNIRTHALRLVQLLDIALLGKRMSPQDWDEVAAGQRAWWVLPPLLLAQRYFGSFVPDASNEKFRTACPAYLAFAARRYTLTGVSWSNLRIAAFPGIAWSRSLGEAARFAYSRARPTRTALADLQDTLERQPHLTQVSWYQLPHWMRIARWVFTRPPRVQTIAAVRAALSEQPHPRRAAF